MFHVSPSLFKFVWKSWKNDAQRFFAMKFCMLQGGQKAGGGIGHHPYIYIYIYIYTHVYVYVYATQGTAVAALRRLRGAAELAAAGLYYAMLYYDIIYYTIRLLLHDI